MRFWLKEIEPPDYYDLLASVSTLLEILAKVAEKFSIAVGNQHVSTLLEILDGRGRPLPLGRKIVITFQPFLRFWGSAEYLQENCQRLRVSTLLEILGLVCLVVVGF